MKLLVLALALSGIRGVVGDGEKIPGDELFNFINLKVFNKANTSEALVKDKCMIQLLKETINQFGNTYVYITDDRRHEELVRDLQMNFLHSYFTEPQSLRKSRFNAFYNLHIFKEKFKFGEILKKVVPLQSAKFFILVRNRQELIEKFTTLWSHRLINVVGCYIADGFIFCYTYFPYSPINCNGVGEPYLTQKCDIRDGRFSLKEELFPKKLKNLHRCPINITFTENVPSSYYTSSKKLTGWEIDFLNEIIERMNGIPVYTILPHRKRTYKATTGYSSLVENSEIGGGLVVSLRGLIYTDFCMYGKTLCITWIVPRKEPSPHSPAFLIKVFPVNVWILLLLVYLAMGCTIKTFHPSATYHNIFFKLFPFLLTNTTRTRKISKKLQALWIFFCFLMNAIYQSGYQSTILVPNTTKQISTTKEVLDSNLKIFGILDVTSDAMNFFKERKNISSRRLRLLNRRLSYEDWIYRMTVKKDSAFLGFKETVSYHTELTGLASKLYIPDNCVINYFLAFVLKKHSHLTENFVKFSNRLNENGFLEYFFRKHLLRKSQKVVPKKLQKILKPLQNKDSDYIPPPIDEDKIFVVFMLYFIGNTIALGVFILEKNWKWDWKEVKKNISREFRSAWG